MLVSRRARLDRFPWPVHLDDFRLAGRVKRQGRPDIWIYDHHENGGSVCIDATGQTYRFIATPNGKGVGQFRPCELRSALWRARLPDVVAPVSYDLPSRRDRFDRDDGPGDGGDVVDTEVGDIDIGGNIHGDAEDGGDAVDGDDIDESRVVRRGHLTLVAG
jgi:hypothetical protein